MKTIYCLFTAHIQRDSKLTNAVRSLKECITILFVFQRKPARDQTFVKDTQNWLHRLVSVSKFHFFNAGKVIFFGIFQVVTPTQISHIIYNKLRFFFLNDTTVPKILMILMFENTLICFQL